MVGIRKLRSAARYGARHLTTINEDVQTESSYSRAMRSDLNLAIILLESAPAMVQLLGQIIDYVDAGCEDLRPAALTARHILNKIQKD